MAQLYGYDAGEFRLQPNQEWSYFWDVPEFPGNTRSTWTVTPFPNAVLDGPAHPEQRVEVVDFFLLRKGPDAEPPGPNKLQLNYKLRNVGKNPVAGHVIISAVTVQ